MATADYLISEKNAIRGKSVQKGKASNKKEEEPVPPSSLPSYSPLNTPKIHTPAPPSPKLLKLPQAPSPQKLGVYHLLDMS